MSAPRKSKRMPRDVAPEFCNRSERALPDDEPVEILRDLADERARWVIEHDPRRRFYDNTVWPAKGAPTA
jgi:hypothetical protein